MKFLDYVLKEVREKRLHKLEALELLRQYETGSVSEPKEHTGAGSDQGAAQPEAVAHQMGNRPGITLLAMAGEAAEGETTTADIEHLQTAGVDASGYADVESTDDLSETDVRRELRRSLAEALYMEESDIDDRQPFMDMGLDSIVGVEWIGQLNRVFGLALSATKIYDHPNIETFAAFLSRETRHPKAQSRVAEVAEAAQERPRMQTEEGNAQRRPPAEPGPSVGGGRVTPSQEPIAIIGMSGRYPGAADLGEFWNNLVAGRSSVAEIPRSRWDMERYYDSDPDKLGRIYCKWLGALADIDCFDPLFFRISPAEAAAMDPQHRIFLQEAHRAFEAAAYSSSRLDGRNCGVYLGIMNSDYGYLSCMRGEDLEPEELLVSGTSNSFAIAAGRVAYHLNLRGPAIALDTACSSSLVATHLACQALHNGEIDMALVGGVTLYLSPQSYVSMCAARMLSPEGKCKVFDDSADGFVPGEGAGAVVLRRLKDAERDGDRILGLIAASGINQDGRTNGLTAPSADSQQALMRSIYRTYGIDTNEITYVETHGTGTKLGDPIELEALVGVFKENALRNHYCALGSVKSNIGHTSAASGMASLHKVLLSLGHQLLVPSVHYRNPNRHFDFVNSPFYVNTEVKYWDRAASGRRRAAISSFGFSGTNSHVVIEEYVDTRASTPYPLPVPPPAVAIVVSAKDKQRLTAYAANLLEWLRANMTVAHERLADLAYTLQIGREAMEERLGIVAASSVDLEQKLKGFLSGNAAVAGVYSGRVTDRSGDAVERSVADDYGSCGADAERLCKAVELWVAGSFVDWKKLYRQHEPRVIDAPTYPFATQRYWIGRGRRELYATLLRDLSERKITTEEAIELSLDN